MKIKTPLFMSWEVTSLCNLSCQICYANAQKHNDNDLKASDVDSIIEQIVACNPLVLDIGGGEPLLRKDIFHILEKLQSNNIMVRLATNGHIAPIEELKKCGVNTIQVSVDGFCETHEKIRGKNSYDKTIENIGKYIDAGFRVGIATVITSYNISELPKLIRYFYQLGAAKHISFRFVPMGRGAEHPELWVTEEPLKQLRTELKKLESELGKEFLRFDHSLNFFSGENWSDGGGCILGQDFLGIKPNGDIVACPFFPTVIGNVKTNNLQNLWINSPLLAKLRESVKIDKLEGRCKECPENIKKVCRGGCRAVAYHISGNIHAPDPRCWR